MPAARTTSLRGLLARTLLGLLGLGAVGSASAADYGQPLPGLSEAELRRFDQGDRLFATRFAATGGFAGLGPTYIARACADCHVRDGRARPPDHDHPGLGPLTIWLQSRDGLPLPHYGRELSTAALPGIPSEAEARLHWSEQAVPAAGGMRLRWPELRIRAPQFGPLPQGHRRSLRMATAIIGLGLLAGVPEAELRAGADPADADADGISGRVQIIDGRVGRFGWKAGEASLAGQIRSAAWHDLGLRSAARPAPNCPPAQAACLRAAAGEATVELRAEWIEWLAFYLATHAVPAPRSPPGAGPGAALFRAIGCADCHRPLTGTSGHHPIAALDQQPVWAYTDLLLHDLGPELADGFVEGIASGSEWRTAPLWGLNALPRVNGHRRLLHDGRADGVVEAIGWHGGEAAASRRAFFALDAAQRRQLLDYVEGR